MFEIIDRKGCRMLHMYKLHNFGYRSFGENFPREQSVPEVPHLGLWISYPKHLGRPSALEMTIWLAFTCEQRS